MTEIHDNRPRRTEADVDSETRFGTRHVPEGHHASAPYRPSHQEPRRVIPSGRLGPDGAPYPAPSLGAKILVWGGIGVMAAAATAGTILAARKIANAIHDDAPRRPSNAPRTPPADRAPRGHHPGDDYPTLSARSRARFEAEERARAAHRQNRPRAPQPPFMSELRDTTGGMLGLIGSLNAAVAGFRTVARQAGDIMREFSDSADTVRAVLDRKERSFRDKPETPDSTTEHHD